MLGVVVDDAIIVGENIYRHQEEHGDGLRGAIEGAREIARPVTFAVLTTVAAFSPLLFVPGMMGKVLRVIPLVVIPCLLFSLLESLNILPAHLAHIPGRVRRRPWRRLQSRFANGLKHFAQGVYCPMLDAALRWRYLTAAVGAGVMIVTVGLVLSGRPGCRVVPALEADAISASMTMPHGSPVETTGEGWLGSRRAWRGCAAACSRRPAGTTSCTCWRWSATSPWPRGAAGARIRLHPPRRPQPRRQRHRLRRCHRGVGRGRHRRPRRPHPPRGAGPPSRRVFYTFEGVIAEQRDVLGGLQRGFVLALLLIFALLAVPLRSYVQPSSS